MLLAAAVQHMLPSPPVTCIGIDLGTTFSCVAVFEDGEIVVVNPTDGSAMGLTRTLFDYANKNVSTNGERGGYLDVSMAQLCLFILLRNLDFGEAMDNEFRKKL